MCDTKATKTSTCPNCQQSFQYTATEEPAWLPFCCDRCQWIDLGRWMSGDYRISKSILANDDDQID